MFTRVFGKTSFWSYLVAFLMLAGAVYWHHGIIMENDPSNGSFSKSLVILVLGILSIFCLEVSVKGAFFLQKGNYHLPVFILFFWILPIYEWNIWLWIATIFLWVSILQISRAGESAYDEKVVFNAGFWMLIASSFKVDFYYFFLSLWGVLYLKGLLNFKYIFLTLLPALCIFMIGYMCSILLPEISFIKTAIASPAEFSFLWSRDLFGSTSFILIILLLTTVTLKHFQGKYQERRNHKTSFYISIVLLFSSIIVILFGGERSGVSWISLIMVTAMLSTHYFESKSNKWINVFFYLCLAVIFQNQIRTIFS
tara:strand:- start:53 stop:985 length:933 start_codon:yes stop_codon:yes gene_type:complete